jgi:hypothetical protein
MPARPITLTALLLATGAVAACKVDNRPLLARGQPAPAYAPADAATYAYGPGPLELPYAEPARVTPAATMYDGYALAERAYAYDRAAYRSPPDYGFQYGDVQPWAWQTAGDDLMFAEPVDDGYRFYYYEPGEAQPYFVRDPDYGYGYGDNGVLTALFSAAGALLPNDQLYRQADVAGRYLYRGQDLRRTYYAEPRYAVAEPLWSQRAPILAAAQAPWIAAADRVEPWRQYRVSTGERQLRSFEPERLRREKDIAKFERKMAKADDHRPWREENRGDDRQAMVAYAPAPVVVQRERGDDHGGGRQVAQVEQRQFRGGDDHGGGDRHDGDRGNDHGQGGDKSGDHGGGDHGGGDHGKGHKGKD